MEPIVYIKLKKKIKAKQDQQIQIQDLADIVAAPHYEEMKKLPMIQVSPRFGNYSVIEAIQVVNMIQTKFPELDVRVLGPLYTIIETETPRSRLPKKIFVLIIAIFLFTGSGLAIMNFHTEVNMKRVHERIYFIVTGHKSSNLLLLQIPYSIGIGVGMVLFLNHVFKRRFNEEPSPMELEMFQYQEMIDQYVIEHEKLGMEDHKHDHSDSDST